MPKIACLGWKSLIWDPHELPVSSEWFSDGPMLPVEFLRKSGKGRITLVLDQQANPMPGLWSLLEVADLRAATIALPQRSHVQPAKYSRKAAQARSSALQPVVKRHRSHGAGASISAVSLCGGCGITGGVYRWPVTCDPTTAREARRCGLLAGGSLDLDLCLFHGNDTNVIARSGTNGKHTIRVTDLAAVAVTERPFPDASQ